MKRSYLYRVFLAVYCLLLTVDLKAQDPQYSQYYAAPLYLNPAFAGSEGLPRAGFNYRNQWPGLQAQFTTFSAFIDTYLPDYNSGIGLMVMSDTEGAAKLRSTTIAALYSYELRISEGIYFRPGFRGSYIRREIGFWDQLIFANQIDPNNIFGPTLPGDIPNLGEPVNLLSLSAGGLLFTENFWFGFAADHLNEPNQSFIDAGNISKLPAKYSIHTGVKIPLGTGGYRRDFTHQFEQRYLVPTLNYKRQGPFEQLDLGAYLYMEPLILGLWYRGLPYRPVEQQSNRDAIVLMAGVNLLSGVNIGYSFDYTVSRLGIQSGGAHEISVSFLLGDRNRPQMRQRSTILPCPKF